MAITTQGEVKVVISMIGAGNAPAKVNETTEAIKKTDAAAKSAGEKLLGMREKIQQVAQIAGSAFGSVVTEIGAVVTTTTEATSKFGVLGTVVTGVVGITAGLAFAFSELDKLRFAGVTASLQTTAKTAGELARQLGSAATNAKNLNAEMRSAEVRALTAQIATKMAQGDVVGAGVLRGQLATLTAGYESGDLRKQGGQAFGDAQTAAAARVKGEIELRKTEDRIALIERAIAIDKVLVATSDPAVYQQLGRERYELRQKGIDSATAPIELAGLQGIRATQIGSLGLLPGSAPGEMINAGVSLYGAASAVQQEGQANAVKAVIDGATAVLTNYIKNNGLKPPGEDEGFAGYDNIDDYYNSKQGRGAGRDSGASARDFRMMQRRLLRASGDTSAADAKALAGRQKMATDIATFSSALTEALPQMGQFADALSKISDIWTKWGETGKNTATAVVGSLGAIGLAGAELIKNDRLRAGVKAIIYGAEGAVHLLTPGMQALGAAEIGAAVALGGIAIFGGSGGGGGGARSTAPQRVSSGRDVSAGAVNINIYGGWFGGQSPQESGAALEQRIRRAQGTGFERRDAA